MNLPDEGESNALKKTGATAAGFSILEVIVVLAIIGILSAIAAPGWLTLVNRQRLSSARDEVLQAMRSTQSQAKRTRRPSLLEFDSSGYIPEVQGIELGDGNLKPNMVTLTVSDYSDNPIGDIDDDGLLDIQFDQHGAISEDSVPDEWPIRIVLSSSGMERCILIDSLLGSTRLRADDDCDSQAN
ncbi:MAG: Tfp pilus assembly protein FimT/FimU [Leptolyngbyaceae cyanobacterium]